VTRLGKSCGNSPSPLTQPANWLASGYFLPSSGIVQRWPEVHTQEVLEPARGSAALQWSFGLVLRTHPFWFLGRTSVLPPAPEQRQVAEKNMKTKIRMTFDKVRHDQPNDIHCVVSLQAPKLEWQKKRPPICVTNAIDVSGSMSGEKMHFAKQSVLKLADHLKPGDWCGGGGFRIQHPPYLRTP